MRRMQRAKSTRSEVVVWDPWLRMFHWLLVMAVGTAWWSHDGNLNVHLIAGAAIGGLWMFRMFWGVWGERYARFTDFMPSTRTLATHAWRLFHGNPFPVYGHPPLGAIMVFALLAALGWMWLSGLVVMGLQLGIGPFAGVQATFVWETRIADWHAWVGEMLPWLVGVHLTGVLVESLLLHENLVWAMLTGRKRMLNVGGDE